MKCADMYFIPISRQHESKTYPKSRTWCWERSRTSSCWSGRRLKKRNFVVRKLYNMEMIRNTKISIQVVVPLKLLEHLLAELWLEHLWVELC